jgi:hypothetical protein
MRWDYGFQGSIISSMFEMMEQIELWKATGRVNMCCSWSGDSCSGVKSWGATLVALQFGAGCDRERINFFLWKPRISMYHLCAFSSTTYAP